MELRRYAALVLRWLWLLVLGTVLAAGTSYFVSSSMPKSYEASATLLVNQAQTPGTVGYNDILTNQMLAKTFGELIRKRPVLEEAAAALKLPYSADELGRMVAVQVVRDTMLLQLTAQSTDPQQAADLANGVARAFIAKRSQDLMRDVSLSRDALQEQLKALESDIRTTSQQLDQTRSASDGRTPEARLAEIARLQSTLSEHQLTYSQLLRSEQEMRLSEARAFGSVTVAEPAVANPSPVGPKVAQNVLLAALVGLGLALGVALLIEYLDDTVKSAEVAAGALGAPALGFVTRLKRQETRELVLPGAVNPRSSVAESFRVLRTNLQFSLLARAGKAILVSSAGPGEGKSTVVVHLGLVMAQAGKRVILVDTDLRRPTLHKYFNLSNDQGVTTTLLEPDSLDRGALRSTEVENLRVLTSGPLPPNPSELLGSPVMAHLVEELRSRCDMVIFDSPPVLVVTDPTVMASLMDGVLVVVDSGATRVDTLARVRERLERALGSAKLLGAVLNKLSPTSGDQYYYQERYHADGGRKNGHSDEKLGKGKAPVAGRGDGETG